MGFLNKRASQVYDEYEDKDFCYDDIVTEGDALNDPDLEVYEDEFEVEPYLDGFRQPRTAYPDNGRPVFTVGIAIAFVLVLLLIGRLVWLAMHHERTVPEANIPVATEVVEDVVETAEEETNGEEEPDTQEDENITEEPEVFAISAQEPVVGTEEMEFAEVSDIVTAKYVANLHSIPDARDMETTVGQLLNRQTLTRTGINESTGWSRAEYEGSTVYIITEYLTDDLEYEPDLAEMEENQVITQDGRTVLFATVDDYLQSNSTVNLRTEPSTAAGRETVGAKISGADVVHRTGISPDSGWSRVEYEGATLYVVTGYMNIAEGTNR